MAKYESTIGLEIHVALNTKSKMFCDSPNDHSEKLPNLNICPVCTGHPGTLPNINKEAIKKLMMVGVALNCKIAELSKFDRKNYFYPDLPKGYQISQYDLPLCYDGWLEIGNKKIRVTRIHMEEDAGRLLHPIGAKYTLVDYNRAGAPLMELVTEPDLKTADDVRKFAQELQLILRYVGASEANMEKGEMRVEVNISLSDKENQLGTKVEVKNINSSNAAGRAVEYEIKRQTELLEKGEKVIQETRGWDEDRGITFSQRIKEGSADYRYFPEPDLPPMRFSREEAVNVRASLPELPNQRRIRFKKEYKLPDSDIEVFTVNKSLGDFFEKVISELREWDLLVHKNINKPSEEHTDRLIKLAANYMITELQKLLGVYNNDMEGLKITPENFAEFVVRVHNGEVSSSGGQLLLAEMFETGSEPEDIIRAKDLEQVSDEAIIELAADGIIDKNPKAVEDYKKGKPEALKFLIGQLMRETKSKANPEIAGQILKKRLG